MDKNSIEDYARADRLKNEILRSFKNILDFAHMIAHLRGRNIITDYAAVHVYEKLLGCNGGNNIMKISHSEKDGLEWFLNEGTGGLITWLNDNEIEGVKKELERLRNC